MPTSQFTINVSPISTVWFQSAASKAFGSQFTISIPFTFQGVVPAGQIGAERHSLRFGHGEQRGRLFQLCSGTASVT